MTDTLVFGLCWQSTVHMSLWLLACSLLHAETECRLSAPFVSISLRLFLHVSLSLACWAVRATNVSFLWQQPPLLTPPPHIQSPNSSSALQSIKLVTLDKLIYLRVVCSLRAHTLNEQIIALVLLSLHWEASAGTPLWPCLSGVCDIQSSVAQMNRINIQCARICVLQIHVASGPAQQMMIKWLLSWHVDWL